jgi:nicotinate phosphoribosyltransferase
MTRIDSVGPLFTDLYELTMAAGYFDRRIDVEATFSVFVRDCPRRNFFVAAGLEDVLRELAEFRFGREQIDYLGSLGLFSPRFLSHLERLRFTGAVHALPEGSLFFPEEPILEVTAPIIEAQLIETFLLNTLGFQSMIASKAARCVHAARGRPLIDFSLRRTQGLDAGIKVARSIFIAGFSATSNVLAGKVYGIPVSGTMAHSFISAFEREEDAFSAYAESFPDNSVFLIDTYDTLEGARAAARVGLRMKGQGRALRGVRLDSGDMIDLSRRVRSILDDAGLAGVKIFASSGFDEQKIAGAVAGGARIDAFGVGTKVGVSADAPFLDIVYKMVRFAGRDVRKKSPGKKTLAGEKQVFRKTDRDGRMLEDVIGLRDERIADAVGLLEPVMIDGKPLGPPPPLESIRDRFSRFFATLDDRYKSLDGRVPFPVRISPALAALQKRL